MELVGPNSKLVKWKATRDHIMAEGKESGEIGLRGFDLNCLTVMKRWIERGLRDSLFW